MLSLGKCPHGKPKISWTVKKEMGSEDEKLMEVTLQLQECPQIYNLASSGLLMSFLSLKFQNPVSSPKC